MINQEIEEVTFADVESLIEQEVIEQRTLEYKEALPSAADDSKREFLYDVSSFANAEGGDLVYGVSDQRIDGRATGIPGEISGLKLTDNIAVEISRLEAIIQSSIEPRIEGLKLQLVQGSAGQVVLIIRVPESLSAPHMVKFKGATKFYSRNSSGKYNLDVHEIRSAFARSADLPAKLQAFRDERALNIKTGKAPVRFGEGPRLLLHVLPVSALAGKQKIDFTKHDAPTFLQLFPLQRVRFSQSRYNLDGLLLYDTSVSYCQIFRTGVIELAVGAIFGHQNEISLGFLELLIIEFVEAALSTLRKLAFEPPIIVAASLLDVRGYTCRAQGFHIWISQEVDRDDLFLSDVLVQDHNVDVSLELRPVFDMLAQSMSLKQSPYYNDDGSRKSMR